MDNITNVSIDNLSKAVVKVLDKIIASGEITEADKLVLIMYQKEKARAVAVPNYKKIINGFKEIVSMLKDILPQNDESVTFEESQPIETQSVEVNTDEL